MMRILSYFIILLWGMMCLKAQPPQPQAVAPHWQAGDKRLLQIVQGKFRFQAGKSLPADQVTVSLVEIEVLEERALGYRVRWTFREHNNQKPLHPLDVSAWINWQTGDQIEFFTDEAGGFLEVMDWASIQARLRHRWEQHQARLAPHLTEAEASEVQQIVADLLADRERLRMLVLREIQLFYRPYGYWLYPNQPYQAEATLQNPWINPLATPLSVTWESTPKKRTEAAVQLVQKLDMSKRAYRRMLKRAKKNRSDVSNPLQLLDSSSYVYNLKSGWLESSAYRRFEGDDNDLSVSFCDMKLMPFEAVEDPEKFWASSMEKYRKQDLKGALTDMDRTLEIAPSTAAYNMRALILSAMGAHYAAIQDFDSSLQIKPLAWTYAHRAEIWTKLQQYEEAEKDFMEALALDSSSTETYFLRARMWEDRLDYAAGMRDMNRLIRMAPQHAHAYAYRAFLKREQGMLGAALKDIERAAKLAPYDPMVFRHKALIHLSLEETENACEALNRALWLGFSYLYDDEVERIVEAFCE